MALLDDTISSLEQVDVFDGLNNFARQVCETYRIENLAFQIVSPVGSEVGGPIFIATYGRDWVKRYVSLNYFEIDPVVLLGVSSFLPLDWDSIDRSCPLRRSLFAEAESYGVGRRGITIPVRGLERERSLITVTTFDTDAQWAQRRRFIQRDFHILAHFLHERSLQISGLRSSIKPRLSIRERQCLELLARGRAPKQIAYELDLAVGTVRLYLSSARNKLGASNKYEAIARAVQNELVVI